MDAFVRRYRSRSASATSKAVRWIRVHAFSRSSSLVRASAGTISHGATAVTRAIARSRNAAVDNNRLTMSDQYESIEQFGRPADMSRGFAKDKHRQLLSSPSRTLEPIGRDLAKTSFVRSSKNVSPLGNTHQPLDPDPPSPLFVCDARFTPKPEHHRMLPIKALAPAAVHDSSQRCHVLVIHGQ